MFLSMLKRLNAMKLIDFFYSGGEFLELSPSRQKELILWYLNKDYNSDLINMSLIFDYIVNVILEKLFSYEEIDEALANSRFAETMSPDDIFDILTAMPNQVF